MINQDYVSGVAKKLNNNKKLLIELCSFEFLAQG